MHSSRMLTARSSSRRGVPGPDLPQLLPWVWAWRPPSGSRPPPGLDPPWTEFLTHACENITLPQTSLAGGNKINLKWFP